MRRKSAQNRSCSVKLGNLSLDVATRQPPSPLQDEANFQSTLSVRILLSTQICVCIPQNVAADLLIALSLPQAAKAALPWQKPSRKTLPLALVVKHVTKSPSAVKTALA